MKTLRRTRILEILISIILIAQSTFLFSAENIIYSTSDFSVTYDGDWNRENYSGSSPNKFALSLPQGERGTHYPYFPAINVQVKNLTNTPTLDEYVNAFGNIGVEILSQEDTILSGFPAKKIIYRNVQPEAKFKYIQILTLKDQKVYSLWYSAEEEDFDKYLNDFSKIVESFIIK